MNPHKKPTIVQAADSFLDGLAEAIARKVAERMELSAPQPASVTPPAGSLPAKLLYTTKEAAALLSRSQSWIEDQIRRNKLPARRNGRRLLIYHSDLDEFARRDVY